MKSYKCPKCGVDLTCDSMYVDFIDEIYIECPHCNARFRGKSMISSFNSRNNEEEGKQREEEEREIREVGRITKKEEIFGKLAEENKKEEERLIRLVIERRREEERLKKLEEERRKEEEQLIKLAEKKRKEEEIRQKQRIKRLMTACAFVLLIVVSFFIINHFVKQTDDNVSSTIYVSNNLKPKSTTTTVEKPKPTTTTVEKPKPTTTTVEKPKPTTTTVEKPKPTTTTKEKPKADNKKAFEYFLEAAKRGDVEAMYEVGLCYRSGSGGAVKDLDEAFKWLERAAAEGHIEAKKRLATDDDYHPLQY